MGFRWLCPIEKQSVTNALPANSLRFAQIYFFAMCLFQATYYLNVGNYKLAIQYYQELIGLFNENQHLILNPPIYYLSAIQGVLDSLYVAGLYRETSFFLSKLEALTIGEYSTEFILHVKTLVYIYKSNSLLHMGHFEQAKKLKERQEEELLKK